MFSTGNADELAVFRIKVTSIFLIDMPPLTRYALWLRGFASNDSESERVTALAGRAPAVDANVSQNRPM